MIGISGSQRIGQPRPAHVGDEGIGGHIGFDIGASKGHASEVALPRVIACRIVQQDEASRREFVFTDEDIAAQRERIRRDPLRCRHLVQNDLWTQISPLDLLDGLQERRRLTAELGSRCLIVILGRFGVMVC